MVWLHLEPPKAMVLILFKGVVAHVLAFQWCGCTLHPSIHWKDSPFQSPLSCFFFFFSWCRYWSSFNHPLHFIFFPSYFLISSPSSVVSIFFQFWCRQSSSHLRENSIFQPSSCLLTSPTWEDNSLARREPTMSSTSAYHDQHFLLEHSLHVIHIHNKSLIFTFHTAL